MIIENGNKLLTLGGLQSFAVSLTEKLGLKHNGKWQYDTYTLGTDGKATNLGDALSHLYDQVTNTDASKIKNIVTEDIAGENAVKVIFKNDAGDEIDHFIMSSPEPSQLIIATPSNGSIKLQLSEVNADTPTAEISNSDLTDKSYVDDQIQSLANKYDISIGQGKSTGTDVLFDFDQSTNSYVANMSFTDLNDGSKNKYNISIPASSFMKDMKVVRAYVGTAREIREATDKPASISDIEKDLKQGSTWRPGYFLWVSLSTGSEEGAAGEENKNIFVPISDLAKSYAFGNGVKAGEGTAIDLQLAESSTKWGKLEVVSDGLKVSYDNAELNMDETGQVSVIKEGLLDEGTFSLYLNAVQESAYEVASSMRHTVVNAKNNTVDGPVCIEAVSSENPDGSTNYRVTYDIVDESDMNYLFS